MFFLDKMKKIGILTYYYNSKNIGGLLQAYALPYILKKYSYETEQICFDYNFFDSYSKKVYHSLCMENITIKKILIKTFFICYSLLKKIQKKQEVIISQISNKTFIEFENFIPHSIDEYNVSNIFQSNKYYDTFIIGSDQIFSSYLLSLSAYFGEFSTSDKKIFSYAASSDIKKFLPKAEKIFIQKLQRFNAISVREKTLKDYIESITNKKVTVVLDPTFLLSKEEWLKISNPKIVPNKKYIFCYFLGGKSAWQRKIAQNYADKYGYEVVHLPYITRAIRHADKYLKGQGRYDVGPREFISLINNAECIFTDSFHGMAFSINFEKKFYVFNRDDLSGEKSMNARITDMLDMLSLTSRYITDKNIILDNIPLDYIQANKILKEEKEKSIEWLLDALKD